MALISEGHLRGLSGSLRPEQNSVKTHMGAKAFHGVTSVWRARGYVSQCPRTPGMQTSILVGKTGALQICRPLSSS